MTDNGKRFVNTLMGPELLAELESIQRLYGIQNRSDMIRVLVHQEATRLFRGGQVRTSVRDVAAAWLRGQVTAAEAMQELVLREEMGLIPGGVDRSSTTGAGEGEHSSVPGERA